MSGLRVIAGVARGRRLQKVPGDRTRPITDRVKEALFNILGADIQGASMLDLFAGTGSVGIEALSRGAARVVFVDAHPRAIETIKSNLKLTGLGQGAEVVHTDAFGFLGAEAKAAFDYVFLAPPQYQGILAKAIAVIDDFPRCLNPDGWVIAQFDPKETMELELSHLVEFDRRRYGNTTLLFLELPGD